MTSLASAAALEPSRPPLTTSFARLGHARSTTVVELALATPVLLALALGIVDLGRALGFTGALELGRRRSGGAKVRAGAAGKLSISLNLVLRQNARGANVLPGTSARRTNRLDSQVDLPGRQTPPKAGVATTIDGVSSQGMGNAGPDTRGHKLWTTTLAIPHRERRGRDPQIFGDLVAAPTR